MYASTSSSRKSSSQADIETMRQRPVNGDSCFFLPIGTLPAASHCCCRYASAHHGETGTHGSRNGGGCGPVLDGNALRPGHGPAADRRGMVGHGPCQAVGKIGVLRMEPQERHHRSEEVLDVLDLGLVTAAGIGLLALGVTLRGALGI